MIVHWQVLSLAGGPSSVRSSRVAPTQAPTVVHTVTATRRTPSGRPGPALGTDRRPTVIFFEKHFY
jgi:hypothetical protein